MSRNDSYINSCQKVKIALSQIEAQHSLAGFVMYGLSHIYVCNDCYSKVEKNIIRGDESIFKAVYDTTLHGEKNQVCLHRIGTLYRNGPDTPILYVIQNKNSDLVISLLDPSKISGYIWYITSSYMIA